MMSVKACMKDSGFDKMIELIIRSGSKGKNYGQTSWICGVNL
jgi:hypothetical protein